MTVEAGQQFGKWTVLPGKAERRHNNTYVPARCECGRERRVSAGALRRGASTQCQSCRTTTVNKRKAAEGNAPGKKHGHTSRTYASPTYQSWRGMISRCTKSYTNGFEYYGGRGISVCFRWLSSFENFLADMGERPEGMTLDRIDVNGDYTPDNCRWATHAEQAQNKRKAA